MMNPVLDVLHFRYSWDIQVEKLRRQIYVSGNQKRCNALDKYFTVLGIIPQFLGASLRQIVIYWIPRPPKQIIIKWVA